MSEVVLSEGVVYSGSVLAEAHVICDGLLRAGIPARLRHTRMGQVPAEGQIQVMVLAEAVGAALKLIERVRAESGGAERACAGCGETNPAGFEVCWSCQAELPAA